MATIPAVQQLSPAEIGALVDPRSSPYFAPQESGDGIASLGGGNGLGWLDWSQIPGFAGLAEQMAAAQNSVSGAGAGPLLTDALAASGNRLYEVGHGNNWVTRGIVDPQNNFVGAPQRFQLDDDRAFWNAALLAGAVTGGNVMTAFPGGAGAGATAAGGGTAGGTAGGAVAGGGLTAPGGFTMAPSLGASGAGVGAGGVGGAAAGATSGATGMGWGQLAAQVGSSLAGSYLQSRAAEDAANMQAGVAREGIAEQRAQMERMRELLAPYVQAGPPALQGMQALIGQGGREGQTAQQAQQEAISAIEQSPLFQSQVRQGEDAMLQNASATGGLRGGNLQGALAQFRPAMLQQAIDQQYSRLAGLAGIGQQSAAGVGTAGINTGQGIGGLLQQQGAAMAGGVLGQAAPYANLLQMPMQYAGMQMAMGRNPFGGFSTQPAAQPTAQPVAGGGLRAPSGSSWFTPAETTPTGP